MASATSTPVIRVGMSFSISGLSSPGSSITTWNTSPVRLSAVHGGDVLRPGSKQEPRGYSYLPGTPSRHQHHSWHLAQGQNCRSRLAYYYRAKEYIRCKGLSLQR